MRRSRSRTSGDTATTRTLWWADDLGIEDEPLIVSLVKYRQNKNRHLVDGLDRGSPVNLISSKTTDGRNMPIIDLDFDFRLEPSSTPGHYHLYLDKPVGRVKFVALMLVLWWGGFVEMGYAVWSLRRMGNFARLPGVVKQGERETRKPTYGWFFKIKEHE